MDLTTKYMGMTLKSPLVPSASPLSHEVDRICQMEDAGAGAVVFFSLFEEQLSQESQVMNHYLGIGSDSFGESSSGYLPDYYPESKSYTVGPESYLKLIKEAKERVDIPLIGSLNCITVGGWSTYAKLIEEAGADAIELNIYHIPTHTDIDGSTIENRYFHMVQQLKEEISIPLAVKLHPFFSSIPNIAKKLSLAGADALVLFNRFYQPDFDLETLEVTSELTLSHPHELRLPLRWVSILHGHISADMAITTGIHDHTDILKAMMAGANVAMMASALLKNGIPHIAQVLTQLRTWMQDNEYESIHQMQGSMSHQNTANPSAFERANYMKILQSYSLDPTGQTY